MQESTVFSQRLDQLFKEARRPDGKEWSAVRVAKAISEAGEQTSHQYITQLRTGVRSNPRLTLLEHLAHFFSVPVSYFTEDPVSNAIAGMQQPDQIVSSVNCRRILGAFLLLDEGEQEAAIHDIATRAASRIPIDPSVGDPYEGLPTDVRRVLQPRLATAPHKSD